MTIVERIVDSGDLFRLTSKSQKRLYDPTAGRRQNMNLTTVFEFSKARQQPVFTPTAMDRSVDPAVVFRNGAHLQLLALVLMLLVLDSLSIPKTCP